VSFRGRLAVFFVLIVILPMVAAGVLVRELTADSEDGKADATISAGLEAATALYEQEAANAEAAARTIAADPALGEALRSRDAAAVEARADELAAEERVEELLLADSEGAELARVGSRPEVAVGTVDLQGDSGGAVGSLAVSMTTPDEFVESAASVTGREAMLLSGSEELAVTPGAEAATVPAGEEAADATLGDESARVAAAELPDSEDLRLALFAPVGEGGFFASSPAVFLALAVFFALAILLVLAIVRSLQGQVGRMLDAARRIGGGDFSQKLPVSGRDELAGLADEFNKMSDRLAEQMDELRSQRVEIERSVQRIGAAFASGLDREALLEIVAETAISACSAQYGLIALSGHEGAEAAAGKATDALQEAGLAAEDRAGRELELVAVEAAGCHALGAPLRRIGDPSAVGAMTIARESEAFNEAERDVFLYLVGQASASIENVALHELVSEQAVTDELTGLANKRALSEVLEKEAARARRFSHDLSLLMLDIDDFKQVNDTYGHPQGDQVLRAIGLVLRAESRGVDEPARYGGEEFAVALPETGGAGAIELAERIRARLEREPVPFLDREGALRVTASIGVASMPGSAVDVRSLVAAADAALYAAKRGGKNRVEPAPGIGGADGGSQPGRRAPGKPAGEPGPASKVGDEGPANEGASPSPRSPTAG
jgi:diguanylate cyclase (GGDEF)-like protein